LEGSKQAAPMEHLEGSEKGTNGFVDLGNGNIDDVKSVFILMAQDTSLKKFCCVSEKQTKQLKGRCRGKLYLDKVGVDAG
jgi:hypothetical protein